MATNLAPCTVLVTGGTSQTAPGLTAICNQAGYLAIQTADYLDAPTFYIGAGTGATQCFAVAVSHTTNGSIVSCVVGGEAFPAQHPGTWGFPDGPTNQGMLFRSGTGVPSGTTCGPSVEGDLYVRRDGTPISLSGSGVLYQCQFGGSPGTYVAVA